MTTWKDYKTGFLPQEIIKLGCQEENIFNLKLKENIDTQEVLYVS